MAAITCNHCKVLVLKTPDGLCIHCGAKLWGYEDEAGVRQATVVTTHSTDAYNRLTKRKHRKANTVFLYIAIAAALFFVLLVTGVFRKTVAPVRPVANKKETVAVTPLPPTSCTISDSAIYEEYKGAVGLIWHEYVYEARINGIPIEFTLDNGQFVLRRDGQPMTITASGFFADSSGLIVTNRHVAMPWKIPNAEKTLKTLIRSFLQSNPSTGNPVALIRNEWARSQSQVNKTDTAISQPVVTDSLSDALQHAQDVNDISVTVTAKTTYLGILMHDMAAKKDSFIKCVYLFDAPDPRIDLAVLQTVSKKLPAGAQLVNISSAMINTDSVYPGAKAIMVGYPEGMQLAKRSNGKITVQVYSGSINRESDSVDIQYDTKSYDGASGSPIFNDCGRLIAINYARRTDIPGINYGIIAKHLTFLLGQWRLTQEKAIAAQGR